MSRSLPTKRSAGLLFMSGGRVLLLRRSATSNNAGLWGLPGGQRDTGEHADEAAWRESCEEMGWVPPARVVGQLRLERQHRRKRYDIFACQCSPRARERFVPRLNGEHDRYKWASLAWCLARPDKLHPVLAALLRQPDVQAALRRELEGKRGFKKPRALAKGATRVALRPAA